MASLFLATVLVAGTVRATYSANGVEYGVSAAGRGDQVRPQVGLSASGGVVVWQDNVTAPYGLGISARALDSNFVGSGAAFRVNKNGWGDAENPQVSLLKGGGAVFVWQAGRQGFQHIYARFLSSSNTWLGPEIRVNSATNTFQKQPVVATLANGNVVIVYCSAGQVGPDSMLDVWGQLLSPAGEKIGGEFVLNQFFTAYNQRNPVVAALSTGGFVAAWVSEQQRSAMITGTNTASYPGLVSSRPSADIYARRYDASGQTTGDELLVNTSAAGSEVCGNPSVAGDPEGGFMVVWNQRNLADRANGLDVFARHMPAAGAGGAVWRLNAWTFGDQFSPQVRAVGSDYLAVWTSLGQDGSWEGVYGRFLGGDGSPSGDELRLNTAIIGGQKEPALASDGQGRFLGIWTSFAAGTRSWDIFGQGYVSSGFVPVPGTNVYGAPPGESFNDPRPEPGTVPGEPWETPGGRGLSFPVASGWPGLADPFGTAAGGYTGLFYETNEVALGSSGWFSAKVSVNRSYTGRIYLGGRSYGVSGVFDGEGKWSGVAVRGGQSLSVKLQLVRLDDTGGTQIRGTIGNGVWEARLLADRLVFGKGRPASAYAGAYTLVLPPAAGGPAGSGFGTLKVSAGGLVQWVGSLADGTKVTQSVGLSEQGIWPLYGSLYGGGGTVLGWVQLSEGRTLGGEVIWIKGASGQARYYGAGFTNRLDVAGAYYAGTAKSGPGLALRAGSRELIFSGGGLGAALTNVATLGSNYRLVSPSAWKLSLGITAGSGLFKGSALNPGTGRVFPFQGVLLENGEYGAGYFLGSTLSGQVFLGPAR